MDDPPMDDQISIVGKPFPEHITQLLESFHQRGMIGCGKNYSTILDEALDVTGLRKSQLVNWIKRKSMKRKAVEEQSSDEVLLPLKKRPKTDWHHHLKSYAKTEEGKLARSLNAGTFNKKASEAYGNLSADEKAKLKELSDEPVRMTKRDVLRRGEVIFKKIQHHFKELDELGYLGFSIAFYEEKMDVVTTSSVTQCLSPQVIEYIHAVIISANPPAISNHQTVKSQPPPVKSQPPPVKSQPPPVKSQPPPVKSQPPTKSQSPVKSQPHPVKSQSPVKSQYPIKSQPHPVKSQPPPVKSQPPTKSQSPVKSQPHLVKSQSPVKSQPPPVKSQPPTKSQSPVKSQPHPVKSQSPVKSQPPPVKSQPPPVKSQPPTKSQPPPVKSQSPVKSQPHPVKSQPHPVKSQSPVKSQPHPVKLQSPVKSQPHPVKSQPHPVKSQSPVKSQPPPIKSRSPVKSPQGTCSNHPLELSSSPVKNDPNEWMGSPYLLMSDKSDVLNKKHLSCRIIDGAQELLRCASLITSKIDGWQPIHLGEKCNFKQVHGEFIQIIYIRQGHWITVSNIRCNPGTVCVYDSYYTSVDVNTQMQVCSLMKPKANEILFVMANVQMQTNAYDCGVYAIAIATELAHQCDPCLCDWDTSELRPHLFKCLEERKLSPFPITRRRRVTLGRRYKGEAQNVNVICTCRMPYDNADSDMTVVRCNKCCSQFHLACIEKHYQEDGWVCKQCKKISLLVNEICDV